MESSELEKRIKSTLQSRNTGLSTRLLCNAIFEERTGKYIIRPGKNRMDQVYKILKRLEKSGIVRLDYPGYWQLIIKPNEAHTD